MAKHKAYKQFEYLLKFTESTEVTNLINVIIQAKFDGASEFDIVYAIESIKSKKEGKDAH